MATPYPPPSPFPPAQPPFHRYQLWEAGLVALGAFVGLVLSALGIFGLLWLVALLYAIVRDWRGVSTLRGLIDWGRFSGSVKTALIILAVLCYPLLFLVYGVQIVRSVLTPAHQARIASFTGAKWEEFKMLPRPWQIGAAALSLILVCGVCSLGLAAVNAAGGSSNSPTIANVSAAATDTPAPPTVTPSPSATATPTPKPTATPIPLTVEVTCASAVDYSYGKVCVHTRPGAQVSITISYCSGKDAKSASLSQTHIADGSGNTSWSWTPSTNCRGTAYASVSATWNGLSASIDKPFTVQ